MFRIEEDIPLQTQTNRIEEDIPLQNQTNRIEEDTPSQNSTKKTKFTEEKDLDLETEEGRKGFSKLKGHSLLSSVIFFLGFLIIIDFIWNKKENFSNILDVFKTLTFTLSGYLFGKSDKE